MGRAGRKRSGQAGGGGRRRRRRRQRRVRGTRGWAYCMRPEPAAASYAGLASPRGTPERGSQRREARGAAYCPPGASCSLPSAAEPASNGGQTVESSFSACLLLPAGPSAGVQGAAFEASQRCPRPIGRNSAVGALSGSTQQAAAETGPPGLDPSSPREHQQPEIESQLAQRSPAAPEALAPPLALYCPPWRPCCWQGTQDTCTSIITQLAPHRAP